MIMRKLLILLLIISAMLADSCSAPLTLLHINDTHSHIEPIRSGQYKGLGGVMEQAAYVDSVRCADGKRNVMLLHAGDFGQGTSYFTELDGNIEIEVLNAMGFDAVCLGNHEFDKGFDDLARRLEDLEAPALCANYDFTATSLEKHVVPYTVVRKAGKKWGIIGVLTDMSSAIESKTASALSYKSPAEVVNHYAAFLKNEEGCDKVICLTHLGYEGDFYTDQDLAVQTRNVDYIVGGHSHTFLDAPKILANLDGQEVVIVTAGYRGINFGKFKIR